MQIACFLRGFTFDRDLDFHWSCHHFLFILKAHLTTLRWSLLFNATLSLVSSRAGLWIYGQIYSFKLSSVWWDNLFQGLTQQEYVHSCVPRDVLMTPGYQGLQGVRPLWIFLNSCKTTEIYSGSLRTLVPLSRDTTVASLLFSTLPTIRRHDIRAHIESYHLNVIYMAQINRQTWKDNWTSNFVGGLGGLGSGILTAPLLSLVDFSFIGLAHETRHISQMAYFSTCNYF